ncbi:DMT family transporter [Rhizobiaceae bacterium BDR2-2]|uniref:DMT family transporter n=1 Tax=Ectorhizobium quercum TaxID=2965071 RepID=A0AAE3SWV9_9HYPH|nr:DMT family transporter [Ectorhizobium quercum]MCX8998439.1 DMT family transporter [Ectorhizobium quercum]
MPPVHANPMKGILLKVSSVFLFVCMQTFIKLAGTEVMPGQVTFYRSAFALVPILGYLACRQQLRGALYTSNPLGHFKRGFLGILSMGLGFYGLLHLPLPEAIAIGYALPLLAVVFAAFILKEQVRVYRWMAVVTGLVGVLIISWPKLSLFREGGFESTQAVGALAVLLSATLGAMAMIQVRQLVSTEKTPTIVLYFSITASVFSLATVPFGWPALPLDVTAMLALSGFCGGVAQILLTESYRHADVSAIAPFDYTSILLGIGIAYFLFNDVPSSTTLVGTTIVVGAGIFIIYREHMLGLERRMARKAAPTHAT